VAKKAIDCQMPNGRSQCGEQPHVNWTSVREDGKVGAVKRAVFFLAQVLCSFGQVEIDGIDILIELYLLSKVPDKINLLSWIFLFTRP